MPRWLGGRRGYDGASNGRHTKDWRPKNASANAEVGAAAGTLRARSRDLRRNNPYAASMLSKLASRIVGTGIRPRSNTGDEKLDELVNKLWDEWSAECCAADDVDVYGLQYQAVLGMLESGEAFLRRRLRRIEDELAVPLQLELLEADMLDETKDGVASTEGGVVIQGIEFDSIGRRTGYWLHRAHPGDMYGLVRGFDASAFVPASSIAHLMNTLDLRPGQVRGVPHLSPVMRLLREIDEYRFTERTRKKGESCIVGSMHSGDDPYNPPDPDDEGLWPAEDAEGNPIENLQPGMILNVEGGRRFELHAPASVGGYDEYLSTELHAAAAGGRMTYELATGDLRGVSYSSMRGGRLDFHNWVESVQWLVAIPRLCQPIRRWFIEAAIAAGKLPARPEGYPVDWRPPKPALLDPDKEISAAIKLVRAGFGSAQTVIGEMGEDPLETVKDQAAWYALIDKHGLVLDSDPRKTAAGGSAQTAVVAEGSEAAPSPPDES